MRKTPGSISKARQKLKQEIDTWKAGIKRAETSLQLDAEARARVSQQVAFGKARLIECRQQLAALKSKGMKKFWQRSN